MVVVYEIGDIIKTRKKHPCGNDEWTIIRVGADFKIKCLVCGRIVMLERCEFERRLRKVVKRVNQGGQEGV